MITRVAYLIGGPGSGKTTLMAEITKHFGKHPVEKPVPHTVLTKDGTFPTVGIELGRARAFFGGTDALAMNIQPRALAWLDTRPYRNVLAEGDRLGNLKFFKSLLDAGIHLYVIHLETPPAISDDRCKLRRSNQDPKWIQGRRTKVANLVQAVKGAFVDVGPSAPEYQWLDGTKSPAELLENLREHAVIGEMLNGQ